MENYHLFIADENSLKYHIEYGFVGTGKRGNDFDICLWKDAQRLKVGDKVIFYVKKLKKFYGVFEISSEPFFDISDPLYLYQANPQVENKNAQTGEPRNVTLNLRYRTLIRPFQVFEKGIDEFELIDILPPNTEDVLWSILYRKLKGERGNSPIFPKEYNTFVERLANVTNNRVLNTGNYTFRDEQIADSENILTYNINVEFNRNLKQEIINNNYDEHFLHALLLQHLPYQIFGYNITWIGNEVYSGAGMQAIDLVSISRVENQNIFNIIEVKKTQIAKGIIEQIKKYCDWVKGRFNILNRENTIQPIIVGRKLTLLKRRRRSQIIIDFNRLNISLPIKYFEYEINIKENLITFCEINVDDQTEINIFSI